MTPQDEHLIRHMNVVENNQPLTIILAQDTAENNHPMARFCDRMKTMIPELSIKKENGISFPQPILVTGRHRNIGYRAAPAGKLLELFLEALQGSGSNGAEIAPAIAGLLKQVELPVFLKLYAAIQCPHCPSSIRQLQSLAAQSPLIRLCILDAEILSEEARADQVRSVPTLILEDDIRWTGPVNIEELLTQCVQRDPARLSAASLRQLIEAGDAARVSTMMAESGRLFPALIDLLVHESWSVRLGAMVTAEYLAEAGPAISLRLCGLLWERFARLPPQVQGDVVQVLGQIDSDATRSYLSSVVSGDFEEVIKTTAAEVLEEMGAR